MGIIKTIHVTKKLGTPTKHPKMLVCYDFHFGISNKEEDLMFVIKLKLLSKKSYLFLHQSCQGNMLV
jgi:hypothetical protein